MKIHPLAEIFPMHAGDELESLAADIQANGLREPIWLYEDAIVDGRRRHAACNLANVTPQFQKYEGDDVLAFVISKNLHRRHLNASERAMVAAEIANLKQGNPKKTTDNPQICGLSTSTEMSEKKAAAMLNVSPRSVSTAKKVKAKADKEVVEAVKAGDASIADAAAVADEPKEVQREAAKKVRQGDAKTLKEAVEQVKSEESPHILDKVNVPVPEKAVPAFETGKEINRFCLGLDKMIARIRELASKPGGRLIHCDSVMQQLKQSRQAIFRAIPTHVCPYCQGDKQDCRACNGEGWTNQTYFDQAPSEKRQAMIGRGNANVPF